MPDKITIVLNKFTNKIKNIVGNDLYKVILYGSYARRRL